MATTTTQVLPPGYVDQLGASFANYTTGVSNIKDSPYYVDPANFTGEDYVAGQDQMTTDAQALAGGLGGYQDYLDNATNINTAAEGLLFNEDGTVRPAAGATALGNAATDFNAASAAAAAGQGAGDPYLAAAQGYTGANAYEQFMSPYQQQVSDATMAAYNQQSQEQPPPVATALSRAPSPRSKQSRRG